MVANSFCIDKENWKRRYLEKSTFSEDFLLGFDLNFQCSGFHPHTHRLWQLTHGLRYYGLCLVPRLK